MKHNVAVIAGDGIGPEVLAEGIKVLEAVAKKDGGCLLIVCAGDQKIDNRSFKDRFGFKARMLSPEEAIEMTGHAVGGVCPFDLPVGVDVYLDVSLERFETVFPAAGSSNSAVEMSCDELFRASGALSWETLCKPREQQ